MCKEGYVPSTGCPQQLIHEVWADGRHLVQDAPEVGRTIQATHYVGPRALAHNLLIRSVPPGAWGVTARRLDHRHASRTQTQQKDTAVRLKSKRRLKPTRLDLPSTAELLVPPSPQDEGPSPPMLFVAAPRTTTSGVLSRIGLGLWDPQNLHLRRKRCRLHRCSFES